MNTLTINGTVHTQADWHAFLHQHYDRTAGFAGECATCPVAQWLKSCGYQVADVAYRELSVITTDGTCIDIPTPRWLAQDILSLDALDAFSGSEDLTAITGEQALFCIGAL